MIRNITFKNFENMNSFSNENIEMMLRAYINESSNAALVSTYDDSVILYDTKKDKFYSSNYYIDKENLNVVFENFDEFNLVDEEAIDFKLKAKEYFMSEGVEPSSLIESYAEFVDKPKSRIKNLIAESVADKTFDNSFDCEELSSLTETLKDLKEEEFFKSYQKRLITNPLSNVLAFNWIDPVAFSLYESTEPEKYINSKGKEKAKKLSKNKNFKKKVAKACSVFKEDVERGGELIFKLFEEYPSLFFLNERELKESVARSIIAEPDLQEKYKKISEGFVSFVNTTPDFSELKYTILGEAIDIGTGAIEKDETITTDNNAPEMKPSEDKKPEDKEGDDEKAKELTDEDKSKLVSALKKVVEKAEDEKIKEMAQELLDKFEKKPEEKDEKDEKAEMQDDGTKPDEVKEAVRFLSFAF